MAADTSKIAEHMDVICSCGCTIGKVDNVMGSEIKLTKNDSADGKHHMIPTSWIDHVDTHVHLNKNMKETMAGWDDRNVMDRSRSDSRAASYRGPPFPFAPQRNQIVSESHSPSISRRVVSVRPFRMRILAVFSP